MKTLVLYYGLFLIIVSDTANAVRKSSENLTKNRSKNDVQFFLYTKANPRIPQQMFVDNVDLIKQSNFNKSHQTRIIVHGFGGSFNTFPNGRLRKAYLSQDDYNIISVDWNKYAKLMYFSSCKKVPVVGEEVAKFIDFLNENLEMSFDSLVVIGFSLGAHVVGYSGKLVKRGKLPHIVGLDPVSFFYSHDNPETRLASTDAIYVETIHTSGHRLGFLKPIGSASFYANWGRLQPGCDKDIFESCSHIRSVTLYEEAIKGYKFDPIYKCESYNNILEQNGCAEVASAKIGDPTQTDRKAVIFNFNTNSTAPFGHF